MDMDTVVLHGSLDQSRYNSHVGNPRKLHKLPAISKHHENILPPNMHSMGLLQAPPPFVFHSYSYPSFSVQKPRQPPLLPLPSLPAARPRRSSSLGGPSCPPVINRTRDYSLTPKKSKSPAKSGIKEDKRTHKMKELVKNVTKVLPDSSGNKNIITKGLGSTKEAENKVEVLPGFWVFSPPPSSLPLPSFSLRSKLSCNAEAAGEDTGATESLAASPATVNIFRRQ